MATCDDIRTMLGGYADGQLAPLETEAVVAHLEQCGRCRQVVHDQQRVQHVLDSYRPPPVPEERWNEVAKRLREELEGKDDRPALRTRTRVESLEPTPVAIVALKPEETRAPAGAPDVPKPGPRMRIASVSAAPPAITVIQVPRRRRARSPLGWVAHVAGALAAAVVLALGIGPEVLLGPPKPAAPVVPVVAKPVIQAGELARQGDVSIMEVQTLHPDYNVIFFAGDAADVAAVWVVPSEG